ncbi:MAG TPA: hypothetical protein VK369_17815, partial [Segetibacter sp.]|nr:hypothetical protein [Segetibacter sp.]
MFTFSIPLSISVLSDGYFLNFQTPVPHRMAFVFDALCLLRLRAVHLLFVSTGLSCSLMALVINTKSYIISLLVLCIFRKLLILFHFYLDSQKCLP